MLNYKELDHLSNMYTIPVVSPKQVLIHATLNVFSKLYLYISYVSKYQKDNSGAWHILLTEKQSRNKNQIYP
jgi:N-acetylmuramoyl-L-alanine amidase CwlA